MVRTAQEGSARGLIHRASYVEGFRAKAISSIGATTCSLAAIMWTANFSCVASLHAGSPAARPSPLGYNKMVLQTIQIYTLTPANRPTLPIQHYIFIHKNIAPLLKPYFFEYKHVANPAGFPGRVSLGFRGFPGVSWGFRGHPEGTSEPHDCENT